MSRSAERIAKLREKLAALEDDPTVVEIFGGPTIYFSERARKLHQRADVAPGSTIVPARKHRRKVARRRRS